MLGWLLLVVFLILALVWSPWWWIPTAPLALQRALVWYRHRKPWWGIQEHALNVYTQTAACEHVTSTQEGRDFEVNNALALMIRQIHPDWGPDKAGAFTLQQLTDSRRKNIEDVVKHFLNRRPKADESEKQKIRSIVEKAFEEPIASLRVRIAIAGIIEEQLGPDQKAEYLYQAVLGNV